VGQVDQLEKRSFYLSSYLDLFFQDLLGFTEKSLYMLRLIPHSLEGEGESEDALKS
jgi:hypothetical protein